MSEPDLREELKAVTHALQSLERRIHDAEVQIRQLVMGTHPHLEKLDHERSVHHRYASED